jgi:hypothetical protein
MLHSGIDLHKRTVVISTVDAGGRPIRDAQLPTKREAITGYFASLDGGPAAQRAVVEPTSNWYWLRDLLGAQGVDRRLAHSTHVKAISYAKVKTDAVDAATLAQQVRGHLAPEAHIVSLPARAGRGELRRPHPAQADERWQPLSQARLHPRRRPRHSVFPRDQDLLPHALSAKAVGGRTRRRRQGLARVAYYVLTKQGDFNGTFKGKPLSRTKQPKWPRPASPPA